MFITKKEYWFHPKKKEGIFFWLVNKKEGILAVGRMNKILIQSNFLSIYVSESFPSGFPCKIIIMQLHNYTHTHTHTHIYMEIIATTKQPAVH